jgi:phosphohistidine phosphatase
VILYFLRHGRAESGADDERRDLTPDGEAALRAAGPVWNRLNLRPDAVISSPLLRARRTAAIAARHTGREPVTDDRLRPGADWGDFARAMAAHATDARRVLFVGHEPDLSSTICHLTDASSVRMRPGGLACLEFPGIPEPGAGEIAWLIDPDLYTE